MMEASTAGNKGAGSEERVCSITRDGNEYGPGEGRER